MRIWSTIERSYHKRNDGLYLELISHYVHFEDGAGNIQTKLDKSSWGKVYRENNTHNSFEGAVTITENGVEKRLVVSEIVVR
jgi:hypothetical protein